MLKKQKPLDVDLHAPNKVLPPLALASAHSNVDTLAAQVFPPPAHVFPPPSQVFAPPASLSLRLQLQLTLALFFQMVQRMVIRALALQTVKPLVLLMFLPLVMPWSHQYLQVTRALALQTL